MSEFTRVLSFDRGIERVFEQDSTAETHLPRESSPLPPADLPLKNHLGSLLEAASWESYLHNAIKSEVEDQTLFQPSIYRLMSREAEHRLKQQAEEETSPAARTLLGRAITLLERERVLQDLLASYRVCLHKG